MRGKGAVGAKTAVLKRRTFMREFKLQVIREIEAGKSQAQVIHEYQKYETDSCAGQAFSGIPAGSSSSPSPHMK
jgi:hypothetical protein